MRKTVLSLPTSSPCRLSGLYEHVKSVLSRPEAVPQALDLVRGRKLQSPAISMGGHVEIARDCNIRLQTEEWAPADPLAIFLTFRTYLSCPGVLRADEMGSNRCVKQMAFGEAKWPRRVRTCSTLFNEDNFLTSESVESCFNWGKIQFRYILFVCIVSGSLIPTQCFDNTCITFG